MPGNVAFRNGGQTDEQGLARHLNKLFSSGVLTSTSFAVSQRGSGANMSVDVAVGDLFLDSGLGYPYHGWTTAVENVVINTADATNPRNTLIVVYDDQAVITSGGSNNNNPGSLKFKSVDGTPASSPVDPTNTAIQASVGAGNPWQLLARVVVTANLTTITNANITDLRTLSAMAAALFGTANVPGKALGVTTTATLSVAFNSGSVTGSSAVLVQGSSGNGVYRFSGTLSLSGLSIPSTALILTTDCWLNLSGNTTNQGSVRCAIGGYSNSSIFFTCQGAGNDAGTFPNLTNTTVNCFVRYIA